MDSEVQEEKMGKQDTNTESVGVVEAQDISSSPQKLESRWATVFSCTALISTGYNLAIIGNVSLILKVLYPDALTTQMKSRISSAFVVGQLVGLLGFGVAIDKIGRKAGAIVTAGFMILGVAMATGAYGTSNSGLLWMLVVARGTAGVGAGGEYPVCTTMAAEATDDTSSKKSWRGFFTAVSTIVAIDLGFVLSGVIPVIILTITHEKQYEFVWRFCVGVGMILPIMIFGVRFMLKPSKTYEKYGDSTWKLPYGLITKKYWKTFIGTAGCWAMYNWSAVPFAIFTGTIALALDPSGNLVKNLGYGTLINVFAVPGGVVGGLIADRLGRRKTLIIGFALQGGVGFILAGAIRQIQTIPSLFLVLYGVFLFLGEVGPGSTVFVVAAESYPTVIRGLMIGLSGAVAKASGAISTEVFNPILVMYPDDPITGQQTVFMIGSGFCLLGALIAFFFVRELHPEDDLQTVDREYEQYLQDNRT